jgi:hypothetical protein
LDGGSARSKVATYTQNNTNRINSHTFMPQVRFKPTIPVFEWAKIVHTSDRAVTVIGTYHITEIKKWTKSQII